MKISDDRFERKEPPFKMRKWNKMFWFNWLLLVIPTNIASVIVDAEPASGILLFMLMLFNVIGISFLVLDFLQWRRKRKWDDAEWEREKAWMNAKQEEMLKHRLGSKEGTKAAAVLMDHLNGSMGGKEL